VLLAIVGRTPKWCLIWWQFAHCYCLSWFHAPTRKANKIWNFYDYHNELKSVEQLSVGLIAINWKWPQRLDYICILEHDRNQQINKWLNENSHPIPKLELNTPEIVIWVESCVHLNLMTQNGKTMDNNWRRIACLLKREKKLKWQLGGLNESWWSQRNNMLLRQNKNGLCSHIDNFVWIYLENNNLNSKWFVIIKWNTKMSQNATWLIGGHQTYKWFVNGGTLAIVCWSNKVTNHNEVWKVEEGLSTSYGLNSRNVCFAKGWKLIESRVVILNLNAILEMATTVDESFLFLK
jgi:hypothetical protein